MCGHGDIQFHAWETEHMMASAAISAFDAELLGDNEQVFDASVARIIAHGIE